MSLKEEQANEKVVAEEVTISSTGFVIEVTFSSTEEAEETLSRLQKCYNMVNKYGALNANENVNEEAKLLKSMIDRLRNKINGD